MPTERGTPDESWLHCDRCDFGYDAAFKRRGERCGDLSWVPNAISIADEDACGLLECKGRVWPSGWMPARSREEIADERRRTLMAFAWYERSASSATDD